MNQVQNSLLKDIQSYVVDFFEKNINVDFVYHDLEHTRYVVENAFVIGQACELSEEELEVIQVAAWFHDLGYDQGSEDHEERSCEYARAFLFEHQYPVENLNKVLRCIRATKLPQDPQSLIEEVVCDADLSHLGSDIYWERCAKVRQELLLTKEIVMTEQEWVDFELDFVSNHQYHTEVAHEMFDGVTSISMFSPLEWLVGLYIYLSFSTRC